VTFPPSFGITPAQMCLQIASVSVSGVNKQSKMAACYQPNEHVLTPKSSSNAVMAAQRSNGPSVRYYCTAGNGMEPFLAEEVKRKLAAEDVHQMSGKVLFSTSVSIDRVTELKAAERLFLLLKHDSPVRLSVHTNPGTSKYIRHTDTSSTKSCGTPCRFSDCLTVRIQLEMTCAVPVSFRVSCKCTGSLARYFSPQEVSKVIGVGLARSLGWKADLKNPQLEVNVYLSDDHCLMGIPLTRLPLANRSYIRTTGLRSTLAWAMASLAQIQPGFCVVDPMCGVGTILIEAAQEHKAACFLGMDVDDRQLQRASENIEFAELGCRIHLLKASSMVLPLANASVDAVICDLPFGRKFGTKTNMASNLPVIVTEMERILRVGGTLVILLSPQLSCLLKKLLAQKDTDPTSFQKTTPHNLPPPLSSLKHQANLRVSLGAIDGLIHKYVKIDA
uniref:THUMP domain-containing protein n=1 Tax=Echeneis naucrates TaxID=173247 RepID=A0A665T535_ECHNA